MSASADAASLTIDLDALAANFAAIRAQAPGAETAAAVKADAYGLGIGPVARRLWAEGVRSFYVARVAEGERLRAELGAARPAQVLVLDGCPGRAADRLKAASLQPVLNSLAQVEAWTAAGGGPCALHVDTGMNRLGLRPEEARALADSPRSRRLELGWLLSHLTCASSEDRQACAAQAATLVDVGRLFPDARLSLCNSAGVFLDPALHFAQVRPGISLYGGGPFDRPDPRIAPVSTLCAPVLQVRTVRPGESVGYGRGWTAERTTRVAIAAAGYADGALRSLAGRGYAAVEGARRPLLGRVSMDLIAVDVSEAPDVRPGTPVELWGRSIPIDEAARAAGTIALELLVRAGARGERVYAGERG
jgi:alanine racemase